MASPAHACFLLLSVLRVRTCGLLSLQPVLPVLRLRLRLELPGPQVQRDVLLRDPGRRHPAARASAPDPPARLACLHRRVGRVQRMRRLWELRGVRDADSGGGGQIPANLAILPVEWLGQRCATAELTTAPVPARPGDRETNRPPARRVGRDRAAQRLAGLHGLSVRAVWLLDGGAPRAV